jgi:hypothetical protein
MKKNKIAAKHLVVKESYALTTNYQILMAIDEYCQKHKKTPDEKAKIQIFSGLIYDRQIKYGKPHVSIPRTFFIRTFGQQNYHKIKKDCLACTVKMIRNYSTFFKSCSTYQINPTLEGDPITFYPNCSDKLLRSLNRRRVKMSESAVEFDSFYKDKRVFLQNNFLDKVRPLLTPEKAEVKLTELLKTGAISKDTFHKQMRFFEVFQDGYHYTSAPDLNGRLYNMFCYIKKECRRLLGDDYVEIDISNSQPFILGRILETTLHTMWLPIFRGDGQNSYEQLFRKKKKDNYAESYALSNLLYNTIRELFIIEAEPAPHNYTEYNKCIICVLNLTTDENHNCYGLQDEIKLFASMADRGVFYDGVVGRAEKMNIKFKPLLYLIRDVLPNHKAYKEQDINTEHKRAIAKECFLFWMNGRADFKKRKTVQYRLYESLFPNITLFLAAIKKEAGYKSIHGLVTKIESNLIFKVVHELFKYDGTVVGTVHDAFYVRKTHANMLIETLNKEGRMLHGIRAELDAQDKPIVSNNHVPIKIREINN